jgi:hypothetical protein
MDWLWRIIVLMVVAILSQILKEEGMHAANLILVPLGVTPLVLKIFKPKKKDENVIKGNSKVGKEILSEQEPMQSDVLRRDNKFQYEIVSPESAPYSRNLKLFWNPEFAVGDELNAGDLICTLEAPETAFKPKSVTQIKAEQKSFIVERIINNGKAIRSSGELLGYFVTNKNHFTVKDGASKDDAKNSPDIKTVKEQTADELELRLEKLQELYHKKLISKSVYEEKQRALMDDF